MRGILKFSFLIFQVILKQKHCILCIECFGKMKVLKKNATILLMKEGVSISALQLMGQ